MPPANLMIDVGETAVRVIGPGFSETLLAAEKILPQLEKFGFSVEKTSRTVRGTNTAEGCEWLHFDSAFKTSEAAVPTPLLPGLGKATRVSQWDVHRGSQVKRLAENPGGIELSGVFEDIGFHMRSSHPSRAMDDAWLRFSHEQKPVSIFTAKENGEIVRDVFAFGKEMQLPFMPLNAANEGFKVRSVGSAIDTWAGRSENTKTLNFTTILRDRHGNMEFANDLGNPLLRGGQGIKMQGNMWSDQITSLKLGRDNKIRWVADGYSREDISRLF